MIVFAVVGWKDSGKTTLVERLVAHLAGQGMRVATIKHTHDAFLMDRPGTDTDRHRRAGAREVAMIGANGWTLARREVASLENVLTQLDAPDVVIVEGYKRCALPKIEVLADPDAEALWRTDRNVVALASEIAQDDCPLPRFARDDIAGLSEAVLTHGRAPA